MSINGSPAKIVKQRRFLNQQFKNGSSSSDYGVHASVVRKPEIIAEHPPAWSRFNNPAERRCGGALSCPPNAIYFNAENAKNAEKGIIIYLLRSQRSPR